MSRAAWLLVLWFWGLPAQALLLPGDTPPQQLGVDAAGQPRQLDEFRGKAVILSFWTSWCAPCHDEMRLLDRLQRQVGAERLAVVAVNYSQGREKFGELVRHMDDYDLLLTADPVGALGRQYGVTRIPFSFIIGPDGIIRYAYNGYGDNIERLLVEDLDRLLEQTR